MERIQAPEQIIDVAAWLRNEEVYPEGKRVKALVYCPTPAPFHFLESGHGYMFKQSPTWAPEQYWVEIFAYQLGVIMQVNVPLAYVAIDAKRDQCGALIRWFLELPLTLMGDEESYISGGDLCQEKIENFNRKSGEQHNFETIVQIFENLPNKYSGFNVKWLTYWAKMLVFDALIGNTDRHQDNWGLIEGVVFAAPLLPANRGPMQKVFRISPAFDNGSSMGFEKSAKQFELFNDAKYLERYILKGMHHMKWSLNSSSRVEHGEFLKILYNNYPATRDVMLQCLQRVNSGSFETILGRLTNFDVPVRLSGERANFMLKLLNFRHQRLLNLLGS
jgi:hypothetical protein